MWSAYECLSECQAFRVPSVEKLDQTLARMLLEVMPTGGSQGLHCDNTPDRGTVM